MVNLSSWKIIDAKNQILGRFCSQIAKIALLGEKIVIINAKDAYISGGRNNVLKKYTHLRKVGDATNPMHGPWHPNRPDTFLRVQFRKMLPKNVRGKIAMKRIHVYMTEIPAVKKILYGTPEPITVKNANVSRLQHGYVSVMDICDNMGYTRVRGSYV